MGGEEVMRDGEGIKRVSKKRGGIEQSSYVDASSKHPATPCVCKPKLIMSAVHSLMKSAGL